MEEANKNLWKRSENLPFPSVWRKFDGRKEINGAVPKFWIQDIPENEFESIAQLMIDHYCYDEPLCKYTNLTSDQASVDDWFRVLKTVLKQKLGLVCYMENPDPLGKPIVAGMNCTCITSKNYTPDYNIKGEELKKIFTAVGHVVNMKDCFEILGTDHLLYGLGLYVLPEFRGQGLGDRILDAREPLCRAVGIKGTITAFSATVSQKLAEKVGFTTISEISYEELRKKYPELAFTGIECVSPSLKYMYKMYT